MLWIQANLAHIQKHLCLNCSSILLAFRLHEDRHYICLVYSCICRICQSAQHSMKAHACSYKSSCMCVMYVAYVCTCTCVCLSTHTYIGAYTHIVIERTHYAVLGRWQSLLSRDETAPWSAGQDLVACSCYHRFPPRRDAGKSARISENKNKHKNFLVLSTIRQHADCLHPARNSSGLTLVMTPGELPEQGYLSHQVRTSVTALLLRGHLF